MSEDSIRAAFATQASWCRMNGAAFTAQLCATLGQVLDRSTAVGARVLDWPGDPLADALVLRLAGGLNALVRAGDLPALASVYPPNPLPNNDNLAFLLASALADDGLLPWLDSPPQTNEVGRSAVLMAGLLDVSNKTGMPLTLLELGASAGLNLRLDAYGYDLGGRRFGPADAPLTLAPEWTGPPPPEAEVRIASRRGVDLRPVDLRRDGDRLLAYVWPEQTERLTRLAAAIAAFIADPAPVDAGDAAAWVEAQVALCPGTTTVVLHSIAYQYFPPATQDRIARHMAAMGASATAAAPLAWLRYEIEEASVAALPALRLTLWPGGDDRLLARAHPHGSSVAWLG